MLPYDFTKTDLREAIEEIIDLENLGGKYIWLRITDTFEISWEDFKPLASKFKVNRSLAPNRGDGITWREYVNIAVEKVYGLSKYDFDHDIELFAGSYNKLEYYASIIFNEHPKHNVWEWEGSHVKHEK